jgi:putative transposase
MSKPAQKKRRSHAPNPLDTPALRAAIDQVVKGLTTPDQLSGRGGFLEHLQALVVNRALEAEMEVHLGHKQGEKPAPEQPNRRNGKGLKTLRSSQGPVRIQMPRDRDGTYKPQLVPKHSRALGKMGDAIINLYGRGMSQRDIAAFMQESYGIEVDRDVISRATEGVWEEVQQWRKRQLEQTYLTVWIDALWVKCTNNGTVSKRAAHVVVGMNSDGEKEVLGIYMHDSEGARNWLEVLNDLRTRGVQDILFLCADGLKGLPEAAEASFPEAIFQTCIVHVIRNALNPVPWKDRKAVAEDMRAIYTASNATAAEEALEALERKWSKKYPTTTQTWRSRWAEIVPFLAFPPEVRRGVYTTNPIEGLNRVMRRSLKTRGHLPSDDAAVKLMYLSIRCCKNTWGRPPRTWKQQWQQYRIHFGERVPPLS